MQVTEDTKGLARAILDYIHTYPERHNQNNWIELDGELDTADMVNETNICQTTMCVAGTAVYLSRPLNEFRRYKGDWETDGGQLLGLNWDEGDSLFYANNESALSLLEAVAEGDEDKFNEIREGDNYRSV